MDDDLDRAVIEHPIDVAVDTAEPGGGWPMVLLGVYVGVNPVLLGMLVLPALRRASSTTVRVLLAVTVGLLAFLAVNAVVEGSELAETSSGAFGGPALVPHECALGGDHGPEITVGCTLWRSAPP